MSKSTKSKTAEPAVGYTARDKSRAEEIADGMIKSAKEHNDIHIHEMKNYWSVNKTFSKRALRRAKSKAEAIKLAKRYTTEKSRIVIHYNARKYEVLNP